MITLRKSKPQGRERGVIAIIAGWALFFVVALGLGITEMGFNVVHRFEAHNAAESVAMSAGMVVLSQPSPWQIGDVPIQSLVPGNSRSTETAQAFTFAPPVDQVNAPATAKVAPGVQISSVSGPLTNFGTMLTQPATVGGTAASAVYQFQINQLVPIYSRIVLVLDYSKSMRLYFNGYTEDTGSGLTVLRKAVNAAITAPSLNNPARVNWGLVEFAGQTDPNPVSPLKVDPADPLLKPADLAQHTSTMQDHLRYGTGTGMTDMASAVDTAVGLLQAQDKQFANNPYLGKGVIIIISDGEPDYDPANLDDSAATYTARVTAAEDNVSKAITRAWASNYQTLALTVLTDPAGIPPKSLTDFMGSITGNSDGKRNVEQALAYVAKQPSDIVGWLNSIDPVTHCLSRQKMDLGSSAAWMAYPGTADNIYGYYVAGGAPRYQEQATIRSRDPNNMDPVYNGSKWTNTGGQFWWDAKDKLVELNVTLCNQYLSQQTMNPPPEFRIRWGIPRVYNTGKL